MVDMEVEPTAEKLWVNTDARRKTPSLTLAEVVDGEIGGVKFVNPGKGNNQQASLMGGVQIWITQERTRIVLDKIAKSARFLRLVRADNAYYGRFDESSQSGQELNDQLNRQIEALYRQNQAGFFQRSAEYYQELEAVKKKEEPDFAKTCRENARKHMVQAAEASAKASSLLGDLPALTSQDIHSLIKKAVEEKLTS